MMILRSIQVISGWEAIKIGIVGVDDFTCVDAVIIG